MRFALLFGLLMSCFGTLDASPFTLTPGSLLVMQALFPVGTGTIAEDTKSGTTSQTLAISGFNDLPENLTVLNGSLYVSDGSGAVNRIDLATGTAVSSFNIGAFGLNGLGSLNGNLLTLTFDSTAVGVYSTSGVLQQSITLASTPASLDWNGIASNGRTLYLADYNSGRLYEYSTTGASLGFIQTNAVKGLSGVSYDSSNNSLWIANSADSEIEDLSASGVLLSEFSTGALFPGSGVAVIPVSAPEPDGQAFLAIAFAFVAVCQIKKSV
jgi:hypothetical protein